MCPKAMFPRIAPLRSASKFMLFILLASILFVAPDISSALDKPLIINPDGAWTWWQDKRALICENNLTVGSSSHDGNVQVTNWDFKTGSIETKILHISFPPDDHNAPGILLRKDGHLMAFYSKHNQEALMYYRVTTRAGDPSDWQPEQTYSAGVKDYFTYANPFQLSAENGRIYNFWRGIDFNPTWSASDDEGKTWSKGANHIYFKKGERPYVKYASNDMDTIHFAFTETHPNRMNTSLYHAYYKAGSIFTSNGKFVRNLSKGPIQPFEATRVYNGTRTPTGRAWCWDMALDSNCYPIVVYSTHPSPMDIRYRYARWDGNQWIDYQIAFAGKCLYDGEPFFAGGICLDPDNPDTVYLSSNVNITTGKSNGSGHYEIYRGERGMQGKSWIWQAITSTSTQDNLRPIVPAHHPGKTFVLWFRGKYESYTDYETEIVAYSDGRIPALPKSLHAINTRSNTFSWLSSSVLDRVASAWQRIFLDKLE